jgi:Secretion system C-terminal sorting domain
MRKLLLLFVISLCSNVSPAQIDFTLYLTPDYIGCSGKLDFQSCGGPLTYSIYWDGTWCAGPGDPVFSSICSGTHTLNFAATDMIGNSFSFNATVSADPAVSYITITSALPSAPLTVIYGIIPASAGCDGIATATVANGAPPYAIQWYDGSGMLAGEINSTLDSICPGPVGLIVTDSYGGCGGLSPIMRSMTTTMGVIDINDRYDLTVYPNPFVGTLTVDADGITELYIVDIKGLRQQLNIGASQFDLSFLSPGVYYMIATKKDGTVIRKKVIRS